MWIWSNNSTFLFIQNSTLPLVVPHWICQSGQPLPFGHCQFEICLLSRILWICWICRNSVSTFCLALPRYLKAINFGRQIQLTIVALVLCANSYKNVVFKENFWGIGSLPTYPKKAFGHCRFPPMVAKFKFTWKLEMNIQSLRSTLPDSNPFLLTRRRSVGLHSIDDTCLDWRIYPFWPLTSTILVFVQGSSGFDEFVETQKAPCLLSRIDKS